MKFQLSHISQSLSCKSERRWVLVFAAVVMLATTAPYLLGYSVQGADWRFTGFVISVEDGNAFIGKMLSGTMGEWLFRTPYTALHQRGFLIFLPYILLGKLAPPSNSHEPLVALYHGFRVCAGVLAILATYDFLSFFIEKVRYRRLGLILATLGGGLGWLLVFLRLEDWLGSLPLDFYSPESFGFLSLYVYPHYALARALLLWGLVAYLRATSRLDGTLSIPIQSTARRFSEGDSPVLADSSSCAVPRRPAKALHPPGACGVQGKRAATDQTRRTMLPAVSLQGLKIGVLWLLTGLAQPLTGMVVGAVVGAYLLTLAAWQAWLGIRRGQTHWPKLWRMTKLAIWAGLPPAPFVLYNLISSRMDPFLRVWTEQSYFGSPHPLHYVLAYGLVVPFAIVGVKHLWVRREWAAKLPVAWVALLPVLAYAPIGIQRRLPEGVWVALVVLATSALERAQAAKTQRAGVVLLFTLPSTVLLLAGGALTALHPAEPVFRPSDQVVAFQYLAERTSRNTVVLSSYETGNALPAWAPVFVVIGHGPESVGLTELMPRVEAFYRVDTPRREKLELLREFGIDYVFWGPNEQALGEWDPTTADFLSLFYQSGAYRIFAVTNDLGLP